MRAVCVLPQVKGHSGFWTVQWTVLVDMWHILWGPEARAVRLALWIAVIDQAMASTAIINYAPDLIQATSQTSNLNATLWTSCVTGAKVICARHSGLGLPVLSVCAWT